ncbi:MAG: hypothetical protein V5788_12755 [Shewanella sp.]
MTKPNITKRQLLDVIKSWGVQKIDSEKFQDWMVTYYEPDENDIGLGEPEWTQEAMNIVMNEYEIAKQEKFLLTKYQLAINFITTEESKFNQTRHLFLHEGFSD